MATENSGWPIIGRMAIRSSSKPKSAANPRARMTDNVHWNQSGPPVHRPGMCRSTASVATM